jgi:seryl-tRNA synthetase
MLDLKFIRENPEIVKEGCKKKGFDVDIDKVLELDKENRLLIKEIERIRFEKNRISKMIPKMREKEKKETILRMKNLDEKEEEFKKKKKAIEKKLNDFLSLIPNLPFEDVPFGRDESQNVVLREVGKKPDFDFEPKDYLEIGEKLDLIDVKRAAKTSGTRFGYIKRELVLMEFALIKLAFDVLTKEGFIPVLPPVMLKKEMARGTGYFEATDVKEAYFIPEDNLFLIGTAEQSLLTMHANEVFEENELPKRYLGFSTCFRREAGSYGKDTRGIFRVHQFDKVEMFSFCKPEDSRKEHQFFLEMEEKLMQILKIPYRVVQICTGDLGRPAAAKYDIEAWFPSENRYRETHSTSNCTDYQARRLNIKYRDKSGKLNFVHTINGTAFSQRPLLAILENYQKKDGSVEIPEALQKYLDFKEIKR